jgi:transcription-repair coupling factor (superfamily II helicase)
MPGPGLRASLGEIADADRDDLSTELEEKRRDAENALDPIGDPLALPEDRPILGLEDLVAGARRGGRLDLLGARGGALPVAIARLARALERPIVVVTAELDRARTLVSDLEFLTSTAKSEGVDAEDAEDSAIGEILLLPAPEASPYAEVSPDRRAALGRLSTLAHLARPTPPGERPFAVCVATATALVRKVVPRAILEAHTLTLRVDEDLDREAVLGKLVEAGYLRVPVVEDPGTFAVRGAILDVWPPSAERPVRIELLGDAILSMKAFDPDGQRTVGAIRELRLPPAREAILDPAAVARARSRVSELCDAIDMPTSKARALAEDVAQGRAFFGAEGFLPAYYEALEPIGSYLPKALFVLDDPIAIAQAIREELERAERDAQARAGSPVFAPEAHYRDANAAASELAASDLILVHRIAIEGGGDDPFAAFERAPLDAPTLAARDHADLTAAVKQARATRGKRAALEPLVRRLRVFREHGLRTILTARTQTQAERLVALLRGHDVDTRARLGPFDAGLLDDPSFGRDVVAIVVGSLCHGAILPTERLVVVTEEEVFGARVRRRAARGPAGAKDAARPFLEDLRALSVGDLVVHAEHGVGRYLGLEHRDLLGPATFDADGKLHQSRTRVDLIVVEYTGGDRLFLPVYRLDQLQKYVGGEGAEAAKPKLDRLGGTTFAKTKSKVEKAVRQMADELLKLYAERQAMPGEAVAAPDDDYHEFEATFPFEETVDQAKAIDDVHKDLSAQRPMDRLVCGDVGFGKTEVAIRAAFRVASAGKQVAVLCPTTVLAQQHFQTFSARLDGYPLTVASLSRFQTDQEQRETIKRLKEGKVDVVVGTHRLLSKDVHFKDLGLLVVDEEQRFGVTHKERIKQLKTKVHVLTLTATPIPRTLQMAVTGLRDLSLITTPPVDRRAIRTIVTRFDESVIREAIERELSRGGQVFYVYNRVSSEAGGIYEKARKVQELVPRARVTVAHGQMGEKALEQTMLDFVEGRSDVLCATSIVESGLDIPRANTILIDRADLFGLGQLYQLRGRVGRSKERAYCYLIVPPASAMSDEARARIEALEKHTELGAGFKIAALDLEIRGAGDLLGAEQSGNVASVGFEMFCSMLEDAVRDLSGEAASYDAHPIDPELSFDVEAFLPDDYVADVGVRLSMYKRFAQAPDDDAVAELAAEMEDRFGPPPEPAAKLVRLMRVKCELREWRALGCEATRERVTLHLRADTPLDPAKVMKAVSGKSSPWKLTPDMRLTRRLEPGVASDGLQAAESTLDAIAKFRKD